MYCNNQLFYSISISILPALVWLATATVAVNKILISIVELLAHWMYKCSMAYQIAPINSSLMPSKSFFEIVSFSSYIVVLFVITANYLLLHIVHALNI